MPAPADFAVSLTFDSPGFTELLNIDLPVPTRPATSPRESLRRAWPDQAPGPGVFPGRSRCAVTTIPLQYENRRAAR
ncbi:MAG: hypothetical protein ACRDRO_24895 [Pseudonocardiaceae bacterium]